MLRALLASTLCLIGCDLVSGSSKESATGTACIKPDFGNNTGPLPEGCGKIEGGDIGTATSITAGGIVVQITGWIEKDGESGEYIGFTYTTTTSACITVKASTEVFAEDGDGTWIHPGGTSGSTAHAISNIVVCPGECGETTPPPDDPGDGDGDGTPSDPGDGDSCDACTNNEDCASGICQDGVCVSI